MKIGQYRLSNDTHISVYNKNDEVKQVMQHEYAHRILSGASTFGLLLIMMEKASIADNRKKWLMDELLDISNKMQEQTASFIEYFWILKEEGYEAFDEKVNELRTNNKRYFNYFNSIFQHVKKEYILQESAESFIDIVMQIGITALNVKIDDMPLDKWEDKKDMQRFFSVEDNNLKFNPNKRFEFLIKLFLRENNKNEDKAGILLEGTYFEEDNLEVCKLVIGRIYSNSASHSIIIERISKFKNSPLDSQLMGVDQNTLTRLNSFPSFAECNEEWKHKYGDISSVLTELKLNKNSFLHFNHALGGLEKMTLLSYMPLDKNEDIVSTYRLTDIFSIIRSVNNPIVFSQGKLYKSLKSKILENLKNRTIYIFMENAFVSSFNLIAEEFSSSIYMTIPEEEYDIVLILKSNHILIQILIKGLQDDVREQLGKINIRPASFIETTQFNYQEIKKITKALYNRGNWAIANKSFGFK
jgi:uncharacterized protein YutE (UPF0331/DUF86 family)